MIPNYKYICKHFNATSEHAISYQYDEDLFKLLEPLTNDPRLPGRIRKEILQKKYYKRDLLRRLIRNYAYALRYPNQIQEPIYLIKSSLYFSIKTTMNNNKKLNYRETARWRRDWSNILLEKLYEEAKYYESISPKEVPSIKTLNYWGNGLSNNQHKMSRGYSV